MAKSKGSPITLALAAAMVVGLAVGGWYFYRQRQIATMDVSLLAPITKEELKQHNGKNGSSAYFAYEGKVYDVTGNPFFKNGDHPGGHHAGDDLTGKLEGAPHGAEVMLGLNVVGRLVE